MDGNLKRTKKSGQSILGCIFLTAFVALVIGCGGGGGGGGSFTDGSTNVSAGNNGTNNNGTNDGTNNNGTNDGTTNAGNNGSILPSNKIYYVITSNSQDQLSNVNPDGSSPTPVATYSTQFQAVTPDPKTAGKFAFAYTNNPGASAVYDVFTNTGVQTAGATRITNTQFDYIGTIQYTPDATKLMFTGVKNNAAKLYVVNVDGSGLTALDDADFASMNPAGTKIVYSKFDLADGELWTINVDGTGKTQLTNDNSDQIYPQWSKDGTKIVYACSVPPADFDIWTMNADGSNPFQVTNTTEPEYSPSYNNDASQIAFVRLSSDISQTGIYKVNADGSSPASVVLQPSMHQQLFWTPGTSAAPLPGKAVASTGWGFVMGRHFRHSGDGKLSSTK